jgi:hypothetical protein
MTSLPQTIEINLAAIPVRGFGGACLVLASFICASVLPETRWFMVLAGAAGTAFGGAMILIRRR